MHIWGLGSSVYLRALEAQGGEGAVTALDTKPLQSQCLRNENE